MTEQNDKENIAEKLDVARKELLDLGFRNKLINHKLLKSKGIQITDELSNQIFSELVEKGNKMYFDPTLEESEEKSTPRGLFDLSQPKEVKKKGRPDRHTDNKIQTPYSSQKLQRRLLNTYYAANTHLQEKGVNILYLALGILHWYESENSEKARKSPLILIPVQLNRSSAQSKFDVSYTGDEVGGNLSLQAKMKMDFGLDLPLPEPDDIDVNKYFKEVTEAIKNMPRWRLKKNEQCISFFSFSKFLMYNDLDPENWSEENKPENHPIIKSLLGEGFNEAEPIVSEEENIDDHLDPKDINQVVNADSSQTQAIIEINQGRNLVVQGPPGTGKSQTISNIIAESIAMGKKVLFVSEKMAALDVVKRRMDEVGLGMACIEIHSHNTNKKVFLNKLESTLKLGKPDFEKGEFDANGLKQNRDKLNRYSEAVNTHMGKSYTSPYQAYGKILSLRRKLGSIELPTINKDSLLKLDKESFREKLDLIQKLQAQIRRIGRPKDHPFWGTKLKVYLPSHKSEFEDLIQQCIDATEGLLEAQQTLADELGLSVDNDLFETKRLINLANLLLEIPDDDIDINSADGRWVDASIQLTEAIRVGQKVSELKSKYNKTLLPEAWEQDVLEVRKTLVTTGNKWWRFLSPEYHRAKKSILGISTGDIPKDVSKLIDVVDSILEYQRNIPTLLEHELLLNKLFKDLYVGEESNWSLLDSLYKWISEVKGFINDNNINESIYDYIDQRVNTESLEPLVYKCQQSLRSFGRVYNQYYDRLKIDQEELHGSSKNTNENFQKLISELRKQLNEVERLSEMTVLNNSLEVFEEANMQDINDIVTTWKPAAEHFGALFEFRWLEAYLEKAIENNKVLSGFSAEVHEEIVKKFRHLDEELLIQNRAEIAYKHWDNLPKYNAGGSLGVLKREFSKKRRHKAIRTLIKDCGNVIQDIKPVFMMSPLSVSTYLPPDSIKFDLVVFDEASQVKPVDAFSPLLRGKQAVVVGDSKQLPPTSFFDTELDLDDEEQSDAGDMESILGLFEGQGVPSRMLRWHYRSEHESLIAVSNHEFYDNDLVLFPSPDVERKELGIRYNHLPDTYYERGRGKSHNRGEAKKVAEAVLKHAEEYPELTLGVAAFSQSQMKAILDELEYLRRENSKYEAYFNAHQEEPFFVKNLENVQGDERDVIFISIGYGKTEEGYLSMNFGPLNKDGGERRLNVLITRARKRCEVFTNLLPADIDLARTQAKGMVALKRYLKFAKTGVLDVPEETGKEADSIFEKEVAHELSQRGYEVVNQVGSAGFYIDLGVRTADSNGEFVLGIECDGATYHSARSARDRDRTRQLVLERIGWNIHRIWSTDWFRNREKEISKLIDKIEFHQKNGSVPKSDIDSPTRSNYKREKVREEQNENINHHYKEVSIKSHRSVVKNYKQKHNNTDLTEALIFKVVEVEAPIHKDILFKKVADELGYGRIGSNIKASISSSIKRMSKQKIISSKNNFIYDLNKDIEVRNRENITSDIRKIEMIAPEEIREAILETVKLTYGGESESIIKEVGNNLGYSRITENISNSINKHVKYLVKMNKLNIENGKIELT